MLRRLTFVRNPFLMQALSSMLGASAVIVIAMATLGLVVESSRKAANEASSALLASQINTAIVELRDLTTLGQGLGSLSSEQVIKSHDLMAQALADAETILDMTGNFEALEIWGVCGEASTALDAYLISPTPENRDEFLLRLRAMEGLVTTAAPVLSLRAADHHAVLIQAASTTRYVIVGAAASAVLLISATAHVLSRKLRSSLRVVQAEKQTLADLTAKLNKRSEQLSALYQVVTEVTDTLSLKYVVNTTIKEAKNLVAADFVALRLLHDGQLEIAGVAASEDVAPELSTIQLGKGIVGRAAKRGKSIRVDEDAATQMAAEERLEGIQSGIVVPLIVGAKVVGTLGCWSMTPSHFGADDERILEMMASQVATAVVAAELHENSELRAHHDALTGLPNRRQLAVDSSGYLAELKDSSRSFAVLMADIDHFKRFNDEFGHRVGDVTLQKVAEVLRASIREEDRLYRYGGEEFLLVLSDVEDQQARQMAERLRGLVQGTSLTGETLEPVGPVTLSIGVSLHPRDASGIEDLISQADIALYRAKETGRNRTVMAGDSLVKAAA